MKYTVFKEVITKLQEVQEKSLKLYNFGLDLTNVVENDYNHIITLILRTYYGEFGEDIISWWLYEDVEKVLYEKDSDEIYRELKTIKQLWEYVEELRKSEDFKEYKLPKEMTDEERQKIIEKMFEK